MRLTDRVGNDLAILDIEAVDLLQGTGVRAVHGDELCDDGEDL